MDDKAILKDEIKALEIEIVKNHVDIHREKEKFAKTVKMGLGQQILDDINKEIERRKKKTGFISKIKSFFNWLVKLSS